MAFGVGFSVFGEVRDEFDTDPDPIVVESGRVSVSGEVLLEDLNSRFRLDLPHDDVDTIGGLIWHEQSRLPGIGEEVQIGDAPLTVRIDSIDGNAIDRISFDESEVS